MSTLVQITFKISLYVFAAVGFSEEMLEIFEGSMPPIDVGAGGSMFF